MIYSKTCEGCREDFNISYYNQLVSEFMLLSDVEQTSNPEAFATLSKMISDVNEETNCISCDDVFRFEKMLTRLRSVARNKMQIGILRDRYNALVGESRFQTYLATASKDGSPDTLVRADIDFLLGELHLLYTLMPAREKLRGHLIKRAAYAMLVVVVLAISLNLVLYFAYSMGTFPILLTIIFGSIGGYIGMVRRLETIPANNDPTANFLDLKYGYVSVILAPISGAIFAVVLSLLFAGGILSGTPFPSFETDTKDLHFFASLSRIDNADGAKLLIWSFLAGFAECLVPDTLDRIVARKQREAPVQAKAAMPGT